MRNVFLSFRKQPLQYSFRNLPPQNIPITRPDIVIIELKTQFFPTDEILPACLPTKPIEPGSLCYASGWGVTQPWKIGSNPPTDSGFLNLQAVGLTVLSADECEDIIEKSSFDLFPFNIAANFLRDYEFCVDGANYKTVCTGDSGGPLICEGRSRIFTDLYCICFLKANFRPITICVI